MNIVLLNNNVLLSFGHSKRIYSKHLWNKLNITKRFFLLFSDESVPENINDSLLIYGSCSDFDPELGFVEEVVITSDDAPASPPNPDQQLPGTFSIYMP